MNLKLSYTKRDKNKSLMAYLTDKEKSPEMKNKNLFSKIKNKYNTKKQKKSLFILNAQPRKYVNGSK